MPGTPASMKIKFVKKNNPVSTCVYKYVLVIFSWNYME